MDIDPVDISSDRCEAMIPEEKDQTVRGTPGTCDSQSNLEPETEAPLNFPSLSVTAEDIREAVKDVRRLTSGGLQQITPWNLKRAILATSNDDCATAAAHLATRWSKGDFPLLLGELAAESKLIALFKDKRRVDVRPISIGCPLRRLLTKAYCNKLRIEITRIVSPTQLGVLKGGYEIGVHSMRELAKQAATNGDAILLLDFENAFNTSDRDLMISLSARRCPDLTNLTWWLYKKEPRLRTSNGDVIRSSTGTQQGCRLSNPLFALLMNHIHEKIKDIPGLRTTLFYWDDTALIGTPAALATAAKIIADSWPETGLRLRWKKCHLYGTPNTINACRSTQNPNLPEAITIHRDLNIEWLKAPIGSGEWVSQWLQKKLSELQDITQTICAMEYKHEASTLLRSCAAVCRIVHLMRTTPPRQITTFITEFDTTLRTAFESLIESDISAQIWEIAKLPPKYGGMGWRTGLHTYGAHYLTSIAKNDTSIEGIVPAWDAASIGKQEVDEWLHFHADSGHNAAVMVNNIRKSGLVGGLRSEDGHELSIAQWCDTKRWDQVKDQLSESETLHVLAHSGPGHHWVTLPPYCTKTGICPPSNGSPQPAGAWVSTYPRLKGSVVSACGTDATQKATTPPCASVGRRAPFVTTRLGALSPRLSKMRVTKPVMSMGVDSMTKGNPAI